MDMKERLFTERYGLVGQSRRLGVPIGELRRYLFDAEYHATVHLVGRWLLWSVRPLGSATPGTADA